jgi:hypothetical protein
LERCGERRYRPPPLVVSVFSDIVLLREVVYMERPIEPKMRPSLADVLLSTLESTNAGFSSFSVKKLLS